MAIAYEVGGDGSTLVAALRGALHLTDVAAVQVHLLKALAEQPDALLVDLAGMHVGDPLALTVFTAATRQAARWPGTPVLFCAPPPATRAHLAGSAFHRLPLFDSVRSARVHLEHMRGLALPTLSDDLLPVAGAARHARDLATDACLRWDLPHLVGPASLVANELVSNVVDHAHTLMTLRLDLHKRYLNIAVRDGSPVEPARPGPMPSTGIARGRGLLLVDATAHTWGSLPSAAGKVVWASLRR